MQHQSQQDSDDDSDQVFAFDLETEFHLSSAHRIGSTPTTTGREVRLYTGGPQIPRTVDTSKPYFFVKFASNAEPAVPFPAPMGNLEPVFCLANLRERLAANEMTRSLPAEPHKVLAASEMNATIGGRGFDHGKTARR